MMLWRVRQCGGGADKIVSGALLCVPVLSVGSTPCRLTPCTQVALGKVRSVNWCNQAFRRQYVAIGWS